MTRTETGSTDSAIRMVDGCAVPAPGIWAIDPSHTTVGFVARHLGLAKVRGRFSDVVGEAHIAEQPSESSVSVRIETASVDTRDPGRDAHLRSREFFDVERHPEMTFRSTALRRQGDGWALDGDLTIKGVTHPVSLDLEFEGVAGDPWGGTRAGFSASTEVLREDWGLTWNVALESGGFLVSKKVQLQLDVELVLQ
jgi:polyisoprenoid-binding protein YceI